MPRIGATELIILLVIVLIIFGVGKLPQIGGAIGKSIREFKKSSTGEDEKPGEETTIKSSQPENKDKPKS